MTLKKKLAVGAAVCLLAHASTPLAQAEDTTGEKIGQLSSKVGNFWDGLGSSGKFFTGLAALVVYIEVGTFLAGTFSA